MSISPTSRFAALSSAERVRLLRRLVETGRLDAIPDIVPPRDPSEPVRLSPAQRDLWVYQSLYPGNASLNLCSAYHFDGPVDPADLETALTIVRDHHDVLRTRIHGPGRHGPHDAADPYDLGVDFPPAGRFTLDRLDLRGAWAALREVLEEFGRRPFDLSRDQLVRGMFVRVDDERSTLVLAVHHIVSDWWSSDVLHAEFTAIYRAVRDGLASPLSRPAIQYADFAGFQRELEAGGVFAARLGFWRDYLPSSPRPLTIGPLTGTTGDAAFDIVQVPFHIDAATETAVRAFARARGASVYGVVFTAFAVFAHRLTGEDDLVIGTPLANRSARGLDRVIGYVMNVAPVRWRIGRDTGFGELLGRFTSEFPGIMASADVPVGRIVGALDPVRVAGRSPLFQWVFMYLPHQPSERALRELVEPERIHTGGEYDLIGVIQDGDDGFDASLDIRTDVYSPEVVRAWADAFVTLLTALIADPDAPVSQATLSPPATESDRLPGTDDDTAADLPVEGIADPVVRQAATTPDAIAVESAELTLTYAELIERADGVADLLRRCGVREERVVALALGRSVTMVVAVLAVQRLGAAYLPIDPDHPADQVASVLRDAAPVLLVVDAATGDKVPETGISRLMLTERHLRPSRYRPNGQGHHHQVDVHPASAAYLRYASDATGRPMGLVFGYAGLAGLTEDFVRRFELDSTSRVPQLAAPGDDSWVAEVCMAFGAGGTLVVPPVALRAGTELGAFLRDRQATCVLIPPPVLATVPTGDYPRLRTVCTMADECPPELVAAWSTGGRRFFTAHRTSGDIGAATVSEPPTEPRPPRTGGTPPDGGDDAPPIGRPISDKRAYVLDAGLRPVPVGVPGELYVAGAGLARGYLNRPGLTAERFVADPHAPGDRMYRTGHLVRWRPDGRLGFLGRTDEQIRVRGIWIDPGEIEAVLAAHPLVARAAVIMRAGRLVGYVVPSAGAGSADVRAEELLAHATAALPAPMAPNTLVLLKELPTTSQGGLDRAALPDPPAGRPASPRPPATRREATLCSLLAELLDLPGVGPDDDFFALGGDSIVAVQLVIRARTQRIELTSREVLAGRTPARLAAMARDVAHKQLPDAAVGRFPATPNMRWWLTHGGPLEAFVQSMLLPVPAGLDLARISAALRTLQGRHEALRMRLSRRSGHDWELEIPAPDPAAAVDVVRVDAAAMSDAAQRAAARRAADRARLDPESGRMLSAVWFDTGRAGRLLVTAHHLAVDGASWHLLRSELAALLRGAEIHDHYGASFPRWARWQAEEAVRPHRVATELPLWERELTGEDARLVPRARPGGRRATITLTLPPELTEPVLLAAPTAFGCGPADLLLTALAEAAVRWRGLGADVLVAIEGDGRGSPPAEMDVAGTVGWLTTLYPVRLTATGEMFWLPGHGAEIDTAIKRTAEQLRAVPQEGLGYGLLRYLNPATAPRLAGLPGPDLWFNYAGRQLDSGGVELFAMTADATPMMYPLELDALTEIRSDGAHLVANWSFAETVAEQHVRTLAGLWFEALTVIAAHVDAAADHDRGSAAAGLAPVEPREL
ncbi:MAG TPA: condensation domain-containing protein [Streptosporangiaceae bacterium]|nr:condensation domain-containing protein [Streptosporangiaceae bacterium]